MKKVFFFMAMMMFAFMANINAAVEFSVIDFDSYVIGASLPTLSINGAGKVTAVVAVDPADATKKCAYVSATDWDAFMQLNVTLPAGKTIADYSALKWDMYYTAQDYKPTKIYINGVQFYADPDNPSQGAPNQWNAKSYSLTGATSGNTLTLAFGMRTNNGNYYIKNVRLEEPPVAGASLDFETDALNAAYPGHAWNSSDVTAKVEADPGRAGQQSLHVITSNYNAYPKFTATLPTGKTLADVERVAFELYYTVNADNFYKHMFLFFGPKGGSLPAVNTASNDVGQIVNGEPLNKWNPKEIYLSAITIAPATLTLNSFDMALGTSGNNCNYYIDNITFIMKPDAITVTLDPCAGTSDPSKTEISAGSGVTLTPATPSTEAAGAGWVFAGWAESPAVQSTTTPPAFAPIAPATYKPTQFITLYAVYSLGGNYYSYPTTSTTLNGTYPNNDLWYMIEDFEEQTINQSINIYNYKGNTPSGEAFVRLDPTNVNKRAAYIKSTNYDNILKLNATLPKTLDKYDAIRFKIYVVSPNAAGDGNPNSKKMFIYANGSVIFETASGYPVQAALNTWQLPTPIVGQGYYPFNSTSNSNELTLALGLDGGTDYYIDEIELREIEEITISVGTEDLENEDIVDFSIDLKNATTATKVFAITYSSDVKVGLEGDGEFSFELPLNEGVTLKSTNAGNKSVAVNFDPDGHIGNYNATLTFYSVAGVELLAIALSAEVTDTNVGINNASVTGIKTYTDNGKLIIETPEATLVNVFTVAGVSVVSKIVDGSESFALPQGVYLIKAGNRTDKVVL